MIRKFVLRVPSVHVVACSALAVIVLMTAGCSEGDPADSGPVTPKTTIGPTAKQTDEAATPAPAGRKKNANRGVPRSIKQMPVDEE